MKNKLALLIANSVAVCTKKGLLPDIRLPQIEIEVPANPDHGDYATNVAMVLASQARQNPRKIAQAIQENLEDSEGILEKTQIAGPGFLNFVVKDDLWRQVLRKVLNEKDKYGCLNIGTGKKFRWNLSAPIRQVPCTSATRAEQWLAMCFPVCLRQPVTWFPKNITSMTQETR